MTANTPALCVMYAAVFADVCIHAGRRHHSAISSAAPECTDLYIASSICTTAWPTSADAPSKYGLPTHPSMKVEMDSGPVPPAVVFSKSKPPGLCAHGQRQE